MRKYLVIILVLISVDAYSQNQTIDSLKKVLQSQKDDTSKVNTLDALISEFRYSNTDTALYFAWEELDLATKIHYEIGIADSKLAISALYASQGKFDEGVKYGNEALVVYNKLFAMIPASDNEKLLAKIGRAYLIIGHNRVSQGNYPEGLKNTLLSLRIKEKLGDKEGIATTDFNLGNIYSLQHNYSEALKYYYTSIKISEELGDMSGVASGYSAVGWLYIQEGNYTEALNYCIKAIKIAEKLKDESDLAEIYNNLGLIYNHQEKYSEALKVDLAALKLYEEAGIEQQLPDIYNNVGLVYMKQKKYNDASYYFNKALSSSKKMNSFELIKWSYENLVALDSIKGNYKNALEHYKLAITYRDSLFNEENTKRMVQQQMQYDFDKKESAAKAEQDKKDAIANSEIQKQKLVRNFSFAGIASILLFGAYGFYNFRKRKKLENQQSLSNERLRISRDLHDEIGSTLGSISVYSEVAKNRAAKNENETEVLSKIGKASRELIDKMSDIVWSLNPENETFEHLKNRMQSFGAMILTPHNIAYDFLFDEQLKNIQLTSQQRKNIFLIFKEAIYNTVKYADATEVKVKMKVNGNLLALEIVDNGKGFDSNNKQAYNGNGLKNMKARAADLNADLNINSKINEGTAIKLNLNL